MSAGPWDHRAVVAGAHSHLRASDADRDQVLEFLKTAFVQGRLTMEELDARAGHVLVSRTYGELAAVTADIPSGPVRVLRAPPAGAARARAGAPVPEAALARTQMPASAKAAVWAACVIAALPAVWAAFLTFYGGFVILFLIAFTGLTTSTGPPSRDNGTAAG